MQLTLTARWEDGEHHFGVPLHTGESPKMERLASILSRLLPDMEFDLLPVADLEASAFIAWLTAKADAEIVGIAREPGQCPLSRWLNETVEVGAKVDPISVELDNTTWILPPWGRRFVAAIDNLSPVSFPVTAALAISQFNFCQEE